MVQARVSLFDKKQTSQAMYRLVEMFFRDLDKFHVKKNGKIVHVRDLTIREFHSIIKMLPYRQDMKPIEVVARPKHLLKHRALGLDCKKKGILIGSYLKINSIKYRFLGSSNRKNRRIHHVFPQAKINGKWHNVDATYSHYRPFERKRVTAYEVL